MFKFPSYFRYTEEFHKLTVNDVKEKKTILMSTEFDEQEEDMELNSIPINNLSLKLTDVLPAILHVDYIEKKALHILNEKKALVDYPSFGDDKCKRFMVARKKGQICNVKVTSNSKLSCDCKGFR